MPDLDLLTEMHTDVKYIRKTLEDHIERDDKIAQDYLKPLWEAHQQQRGAAKLMVLLYTVAGGAIVGAIDFFTKGSHP